eukprot:352607-Chlamydomonas_euryale.AAC.3
MSRSGRGGGSRGNHAGHSSGGARGRYPGSSGSSGAAGSRHATAGALKGSHAASGGSLRVRGHAAAVPVSVPEAACEIWSECAHCAGCTAG